MIDKSWKINLFRNVYSRKNAKLLHYSHKYNYLSICLTSGNGNIEIKESFDEWFWVEINKKSDYKFYKCDRWEGLMELLKDKNIIKI